MIGQEVEAHEKTLEEEKLDHVIAAEAEAAEKKAAGPETSAIPVRERHAAASSSTTSSSTTGSASKNGMSGDGK